MTTIKAKDRQMFKNTILNCEKAIKEKTETKAPSLEIHMPACFILSYNGTNLNVDLKLSNANYDSNSELDVEDKEAEIEHSQSTIYDGKAITAKKWSSEITIMTAKLLEIHTNNVNHDKNQADFQEEELKDEHTVYFRALEGDWGLYIRSKGPKLTHSQIMFLWEKANKENIPVAELSRSYKITPNVIHKIKRLSKQDVIKLPRRKINYVPTTERIKLERDIFKIYSSTSTPFTVSEIQGELQANTNLPISYGLTRELMRRDCNLSYTRWRSRPNNIDLSKVNASRCLFSVKFSQAFDSKTLIINVDESSINRKVKQNYAWSERNNPKEYQNTPFKESLSLILAILSNGAWYSMLTNSTINSKLFGHFINKMNAWITDNQNFNFRKIVMILDNWSYHRSAKVLKKLQNMGVGIMYLPAYSPWLAPVELTFSYIKHLLKKQNRGWTLDLSITWGRDEIFKALKALSSSKIRGCFRNFMKEIKTQLRLTRLLIAKLCPIVYTHKLII